MEKRKVSRLLIILIAIYGGIIAGNTMFNKPDNLGMTNGRFAPCPNSPNCVSSHEAEESAHYIAPLNYSLDDEALHDIILKLIEEQKRTSIAAQSEDYFHLVCVTLIMRFRDDFEIYIDRQSKEIHFRSASRIGHSDFGVNRKRVQSFKWQLSALIQQQ